MAFNPFTPDPYQDEKEIVELETELANMRILVRKMGDTIKGLILFQSHTKIQETEARKILNSTKVVELMREEI